MSNATQRNFAAAQGERQRRINAGLEGEMPIGSLGVTGDPAWDAFFGSLHDKQQQASLAGMGFRADLGGIGRDGSENPGLSGGLNPLERQSLKNLAIQRQGDAAVQQAQAEKAAQGAYVDARRDKLVSDLQAADEARKVNEAFALREPGSITTETGARSTPTSQQTAFGVAHPTVTAGQSFSVTPTRQETDRERMLAMLPGPMRENLRAQFDAQDLAARKQTETERHQQEQDRVNAALAGMGDGSVSPQEFTAEPPDPKTANIVDPRTGRTPNAIRGDALSYALEGKLPALGLSSKGPGANAKAAIQNTANAIADAAGIDLPTLRQEFKTNQSILSNLMPKYKVLTASADTANLNIQKALDQGENVPRTGSPLVNRYSQYLLGHTLTGDPELTKLETYIYAAAREYAKVTGGSYMSAAELSNAGAKKAEELLNAAQTPEAFKAASQAMQDDMQNVSAPFLKQIEQSSPNVARFLATARGQNRPTVAPAGGPPTPAPVSGPNSAPSVGANPFRKK